MKNKFASTILAVSLSAGSLFALPSGTANVSVTTDGQGNTVVTGVITSTTTTGSTTTTTTTTNTSTYADGDLNSTPDTFVEAIILEATPNGNGTWTVTTKTVTNGTTTGTTTDSNVTTPPPTVPAPVTDVTTPPGDPIVSPS